jgi:hypothetical protein
VCYNQTRGYVAISQDNKKEVIQEVDITDRYPLLRQGSEHIVATCLAGKYHERGRKGGNNQKKAE